MPRTRALNASGPPASIPTRATRSASDGKPGRAFRRRDDLNAAATPRLTQRQHTILTRSAAAQAAALASANDRISELGSRRTVSGASTDDTASTSVSGLSLDDEDDRMTSVSSLEPPRDEEDDTFTYKTLPTEEDDRFVYRPSPVQPSRQRGPLLPSAPIGPLIGPSFSPRQMPLTGPPLRPPPNAGFMRPGPGFNGPPGFQPGPYGRGPMRRGPMGPPMGHNGPLPPVGPGPWAGPGCGLAPSPPGGMMLPRSAPPFAGPILDEQAKRKRVGPMPPISPPQTRRTPLSAQSPHFSPVRIDTMPTPPFDGPAPTSAPKGNEPLAGSWPHTPESVMQPKRLRLSPEQTQTPGLRGAALPLPPPGSAAAASIW